MRKNKTRIPALALVLCLCLSLTAGALSVQSRYNVTSNCTPTLSFSNGKAVCNGLVIARSGAKISGTMTLTRVSGTSPVEVGRWTLSGATEVDLTQTCGVTKGQTYTLTLDVNVTGSGGSDHIVEESTKTYS